MAHHRQSLWLERIPKVVNASIVNGPYLGLPLSSVEKPSQAFATSSKSELVLSSSVKDGGICSYKFQHLVDPLQLQNDFTSQSFPSQPTLPQPSLNQSESYPLNPATSSLRTNFSQGSSCVLDRENLLMAGQHQSRTPLDGNDSSAHISFPLSEYDSNRSFGNWSPGTTQIPGFVFSPSCPGQIAQWRAPAAFGSENDQNTDRSTNSSHSNSSKPWTSSTQSSMESIPSHLAPKAHSRTTARADPACKTFGYAVPHHLLASGAWSHFPHDSSAFNISGTPITNVKPNSRKVHPQIWPSTYTVEGIAPDPSNVPVQPENRSPSKACLPVASLRDSTSVFDSLTHFRPHTQAQFSEPISPSLNAAQSLNSIVHTNLSNRRTSIDPPFDLITDAEHSVKDLTTNFSITCNSVLPPTSQTVSTSAYDADLTRYASEFRRESDPGPLAPIPQRTWEQRPRISTAPYHQVDALSSDIHGLPSDCGLSHQVSNTHGYIQQFPSLPTASSHMTSEGSDPSLTSTRRDELRQPYFGSIHAPLDHPSVGASRPDEMNHLSFIDSDVIAPRRTRDCSLREFPCHDLIGLQHDESTTGTGSLTHCVSAGSNSSSPGLQSISNPQNAPNSILHTSSIQAPPSEFSSDFANCTNGTRLRRLSSMARPHRLDAESAELISESWENIELLNCSTVTGLSARDIIQQGSSVCRDKRKIATEACRSGEDTIDSSSGSNDFGLTSYPNVPSFERERKIPSEKSPSIQHEGNDRSPSGEYIPLRFGGFGQGCTPFPPGIERGVRPSTEDFAGTENENGDKITPWRQELRCEEDLYTPMWCRGQTDRKEGYCDMCPGGTWLRLKNSAYWYHKQYFHGVSSTTGHYFYPPKEIKRGFSTANRQQILGLCHECNEWVGYCSVSGPQLPSKKLHSAEDGDENHRDQAPQKKLSREKRNGEENSKFGSVDAQEVISSKVPTLWYKHAHKCHRHQTCKGAIGRKKVKKG